MLEEKTYTHAEIAEILDTHVNTNIANKLRRYGVEFSIQGRGRNALFTILHVPNTAAFKLFCITELGFPAQSDFTKLRNFLYYFLCDDSFRMIPMEMMEERLRETNHPASRQTISRWIDRLCRLELIYPYGEIVYFRVTKQNKQQTHTTVTKEEYSAAWKIYWQCKEDGYDSRAAYTTMYAAFGGVPRKQHTIEENVFYLETLETLTKLICATVLDEIVDQTKAVN